MMQLPIWQLDAFTSNLFSGNPAAVVLMEQFPDDATLKNIAAENNLAETAFLMRDGTDYRLRWFTPTTEVPLCGHATLASAAVVMERLEPSRSEVVFRTASGPLTVTRKPSGHVMNFPARRLVPVEAPSDLGAILGAKPVEVFSDSLNLVAVLENAAIVRHLSPDIAAITRLDTSGVVVTAPGDEGFDFVSRFFAPAIGVPEDAVTGSVHCGLTPYWAQRLNRTTLHAFQASARGGELVCRVAGDRVELEGKCVFYLEGHIAI